MILIVEDTEPHARIFSKFLNLEGYETKYVCNAYEGLEFVKEFCPELLIIDFVLAEMNGIEFLKKVRENGFIGLSICVSGVIHIESIVPKHIFDKVLQKPVRLQDLLENVKEVLGEKI